MGHEVSGTFWFDMPRMQDPDCILPRNASVLCLQGATLRHEVVFPQRPTTKVVNSSSLVFLSSWMRVSF